MTAESLKPFITLPGNTGQQQSPVSTFLRKATDKSRITYILFVIFFFIFSIIITGFLLWNTIRINELESRITELKKLVDAQGDNFDDLSAFESAHDDFKDNYAEPLDTHYNDYESNEPIDDLYNDYLDDRVLHDTDLQDSILEESDDNNNDVLINDEVLKSILPELIALQNSTPTNSNSFNTNNILTEHDKKLNNYFNEMLNSFGKQYDNPDTENDKPDENRKARSISATEQGVPVIEESYAMRRNPTHPIVDDYVKNILMNKDQNEPKMNYDWTKKDQSASVPRRYLKNFQAHRAPPTSYVEPPIVEIKDHEIPLPTIRERSSRMQLKSGQENELPTTHQPMHTRDSRVMPTNEDKKRAFRQSITKSEYARLYSKPDTNNFLEHVAHPVEVVYPKRRPNRPTYKSLDGKAIIKQGGNHRARPIAAHFIGDSSHYIEGRHKHYRGNGLLLHPGGAYFDWQSAPWVTSLNMDRFFNLHNGIVTIKENGLYLIYAQIYYHDAHDLNSYFVEHNNQHLLQCVTMTHSTGHVTKSNTCYTSGVAYLIENDTIHLTDSGSERHTLFLPEKSFFGLVKLGEPRLN